LERDLPAALGHVRRETGAHRAHVIGHSMGGILLLARLAQGETDIRSAVAIGSSLDYSRSPSNYHALKRLRWLLGRLPFIPYGPCAKLLSPFSLRIPNPVDAFNVHFTNIDPGLYRRYLASGVDSVPTAVMAELSTAFYDGGLTLGADGERLHPLLGRVTTPVLLVGGDRDEQCPPLAVRSTYEALGTPNKEMKILGPQAGQADHYGHMDLLMGKRAASEVFADLADWLTRHDGANA